MKTNLVSLYWGINSSIWFTLELKSQSGVATRGMICSFTSRTIVRQRLDNQRIRINSPVLHRSCSIFNELLKSLASNILFWSIPYHNQGDFNHHFLALERYCASYPALTIFINNTLCQSFLWIINLSQADSDSILQLGKDGQLKRTNCQSWFLWLTVVSWPLALQHCHLELLWIVSTSEYWHW